MKRRALLAAAGTTAVGSAGCLGVLGGLDAAYEWTAEPGSRHLSVSNGRVVGNRAASAHDARDGALFALDAETGDRLWTERSSDPDEGYANPIVRDGVYTSYTTDGAQSPEIRALEFDGTVRWDGLRGRLEGIDDGVAYVTRDRDDAEGEELLALDTTDGGRLWRGDETGVVVFDPVETDGHETVYVDGDALVALERDDGSVQWRYERNREADTRTRAVADGVVSVGTDDALLAVDDGDERWRVSAAEPEIRDIDAETGSLLVEDGTGRDATHASGLRGLDVESGDERWRWDRSTDRGQTGDDLGVASRDGVVYVGDDRLVALDATDGTERWSDPVDVAEDGPVRSLAVVDWAGAGIDHAVAVTTGETGFAMYDPAGDRFCADAFENAIRDVAVAELAYVATSERIYAFDAW